MQMLQPRNYRPPQNPHQIHNQHHQHQIQQQQQHQLQQQHQHQQQQQQQLSVSGRGGQQPPLITDTLTACLDVNGTYVCTSYSPRCYIIQKVTSNSVTVTPQVESNGGGRPFYPPGLNGGRGGGNLKKRSMTIRLPEDDLTGNGERGRISPAFRPLGLSINTTGEGGQAEDAALPRPAYNEQLQNPQVQLDVPLDTLKKMLLAQLEYYFSPENLANDKFLVSQMDSDHYVHISTLASFNMVRKLTSDMDLISEVLKESKNVQVHFDGKRVRPISNRTVVILRGIPDKTPVEEITALFENGNCPRCNSCEFAFNDSWYISFESDEDAQRAHRYLREEVRLFRGQPIMARIKSKPTTLLAQGVGVNPIKNPNGFHPGQVQGMIPPMYQAPFVPVSQSGQASSVASSPMYPSQPVPPVFTIPPYGTAGYGAQMSWSTGYYDQAAMGQMYLNGLPPQPQPSPSYPKTSQMQPPRQRPAKPDLEQFGPPRGPRRSGSEGQNGSGNIGGGNLGTGGLGGAVGQPQQQQQQQQQQQHQYNRGERKNGGGPPPPLLGMAPSMSLVSHPPQAHNHHPSAQQPASTAANAQLPMSQNGRNYMGNMAPQSVAHSAQEAFHHPNSVRPYRGVEGRPRSSLGNRKGGPRRDEEYENNVGGGRGIPSSRVLAPPMSPQMGHQGAPVLVNQHHGRMNFDLEGAAFPPLPGTGTSSYKNGEFPYEGRLSDVVKGVKSMKVSVGEKEELRGEIIVSAADGALVVSAASPTKEEMEGKEALDIHHQPSSQPFPPFGDKKEFREIGVGSADDTQVIPTHQSIIQIRSSDMSTKTGKETADKSTRTDEALLNGDQAAGAKEVFVPHGSGSYSQSHYNSGQVGYRKSVPPQGNPGGNRVEVPYSSSRSLASPVSSPSKPCFSSSGGAGGRNGGGVPFGAPNKPENGNRGVSGGYGILGPPANTLNTSDRDAFPTPGYVKTVPNPLTTSNMVSAKPFSGSTEHSFKDKTNRTDEEEKERREESRKTLDDNCSSEDREGGPVRLSYAQVAQSGKEKPVAQPTPPTTQAPPVDDKKRITKDTKETRTQSKPQKGSGNVGTDKDRGDTREGGENRGRDAGERNRDRGERPFRRRYQNRMPVDHSSSSESGRAPRVPKSPK